MRYYCRKFPSHAPSSINSSGLRRSKRVAAQFGLAGARLAQICDTHHVPRPDQGHWTRLELGKPVRVHPLLAPPAGVSETISIPSKPPSANRKEAAPPRSEAASKLQVAERLVRPHPLVAEWIATREQQVRKRERVYDTRLKRLVMPVPLTPADRRRFRLADAIFKEVEKQGVQVKKGDHRELLMARAGEQLTFQLRYRLKRGQRQLTPDELRWRGSDAQKWAYELYETDALVFRSILEAIAQVNLWTYPGE